MELEFEYSLDLDPKIVCRVCLQSSGKLTSILTKQIVWPSGKIRAMPDIIFDCFGIQLNISHDLPQKICTSCKSTILSFLSLKEKFLRSEQVLLETFAPNIKIEDENEHYLVAERADQDECAVLEKEEPREPQSLSDEEIMVFLEDNDDLKLGENINTQDTESTCENENTEYVVEQLSGESDTVEEDEDGQEDVMDDGSVTYELDQAEQNLLEDEQSEKQTNSNDSSTKDKSGKMKESNFCDICNRKARQNCFEHEKLHECLLLLSSVTECYRCSKCPKVFINVVDFERHMQTHDKSSTVDATENDLYTDVQFLEEEEYNELLKCGICDWGSTNHKHMNCHMMTHLNRFKCPLINCGFQYDNFSQFSLHVRRKHLSAANYEYRCQYCEQNDMKSYDDLQVHLKFYCPNRPFECKECGKRFCSARSLRSHERLRHVSASNRKFVCEVCGKHFVQSCELVMHRRMHTGERPFECTVCGKTYKTSSVRAAHMQSHSTETFTCPICRKIIRTKRCYQTHIKRHTQEKPHKCPCGKKFFTKYHMKLHYSKMHEKKSEKN